MAIALLLGCVLYSFSGCLGVLLVNSRLPSRVIVGVLTVTSAIPPLIWLGPGLAALAGLWLGAALGAVLRASAEHGTGEGAQGDPYDRGSTRRSGSTLDGDSRHRGIQGQGRGDESE